MSDWEPRVSRLETGVVTGGLALLGTIASAYFLTANQIDKVSDKVTETTVSVAELKGSVKLLDERSVEANKRLERIEAKLDEIAQKR